MRKITYRWASKANFLDFYQISVVVVHYLPFCGDFVEFQSFSMEFTFSIFAKEAISVFDANIEGTIEVVVVEISNHVTTIGKAENALAAHFVEFPVTNVHFSCVPEEATFTIPLTLAIEFSLVDPLWIMFYLKFLLDLNCLYLHPSCVFI